jgi:hypothetical protein
MDTFNPKNNFPDRDVFFILFIEANLTFLFSKLNFQQPEQQISGWLQRAEFEEIVKTK